MKNLAITAAAAVVLASVLGAQKKSLIFTNRYDVVSTQAGGAAVLNAIRGQDFCAVTPGAGATAFGLLPTTGFNALAGDADGDGSVAQLSGVKSYASLAIAGPFFKWADKTKGNYRLAYFTVKTGSTKPATYTVMSNGKPFVVRPGDWIRFKVDGQVEFFITQDLIMKAAGKQSGAWVDGANCMCQDKDGNLYYVPAHGKTHAGTGVAGGHWIQSGLPSGRQFAFDGAVVVIPKKAITYDASGNVKDVKAASAKLVFNEINNPTSQPNLRDMTKNSGAKGGKGQATLITFWVGGIDIDPNGGTFQDWNGVKRPNLMFTVVRSAFRTGGSWKGTIFSTAPNNGQQGSIAVINGVMMGSKVKADASWLGLQNGKTLANSPLLYGLAWLDTKWNATAPQGPAIADVAKDGLLTIGTDTTIDLAFQGALRRFPVAALSFGVGAAKGTALNGVDFSSTFGGWGWFYPPTASSIVFGGTATNALGQVAYSFPLPNDMGLKGIHLLWQGAILARGKLDLTNPFATQFK